MVGALPLPRPLRPHTGGQGWSEPEAGGGGDHWRSAVVDGVDDFGVVDPLADRVEVTPRLVWPSWRWITFSGTPSRAISTAWAWRSWCGAKRRRTPAWAASRRSCERAPVCGQDRPLVGPWMMQNSGPAGSSSRCDAHAFICSQPVVHPGLAPTATLAAADQQRAAARIEVTLVEVER